MRCPVFGSLHLIHFHLKHVIDLNEHVINLDLKHIVHFIHFYQFFIHFLHQYIFFKFHLYLDFIKLHFNDNNISSLRPCNKHPDQ